MPYSDDYTSKGAPDSGAHSFDLPFDHPFAGYSERELCKIATALTLVRAVVIQMASASRGVPVSDIREHLEGYTLEVQDYLDTLNTRLNEAVASFGD